VSKRKGTFTCSEHQFGGRQRGRKAVGCLGEGIPKRKKNRHSRGGELKQRRRWGRKEENCKNTVERPEGDGGDIYEQSKKGKMGKTSKRFDW